MRPKGKLVVPRKGKKLGPDVTLKRAADSARNKLGLKTFQNLQANYASLSTASNRKRKRFEDGMIMTLLQQNLGNGEIRSLFKCGDSRIKRVRNIMENPNLLEKRSPTPKHAITTEDLMALKAHLSTFETEDRFPCAHRRAGKFFIVEGPTWTKV